MKRSREPEEDLDQISPKGDADGSISPPRESFQRAAKISELDCAVDDSDTDTTTAMRCSLPPHKEPLVFRTYVEYETHYNSFHMNRCLECRRNFPSEHLLTVHIEERHDPLYSCFVEGCERKCLTHDKRRMHLIDKHLYPKNFFFGVTKDGIDGRRSLLVENKHRRRRSSAASQTTESRQRSSTLDGTANSEQPGKDASKQTSTIKRGQADIEEAEEAPDTDMDNITGAMSALNFVPPSIKFGRGRAGFAKS